MSETITFSSGGYGITDGFLTFPAASFAADPSGGMVVGQDGRLTTTATPVLRNGDVAQHGPPSFEQAQHRWVPAAPSQATPDGALYAYAIGGVSGGGQTPASIQVHIVDVSTGTEKTFNIADPGSGLGFTVAGFDSSGVYLLANQFEAPPSGVWLMDATTGSLRQLSQAKNVQAVRSGHAWVGTVDPRDPSPTRNPKNGLVASDSLVNLDLSTGAETVWYYRAGLAVQLLGFDAKGGPVVQVFDPTGANSRIETWLVDNPAASPPVLVHGGDVTFFSVLGDGDRLWLDGAAAASGAPQLYLFTQAAGLQDVFSASAGAGGSAITPAGQCT